MSQLEIEMISVEGSTNISAYGYDPGTKTLAIRFLKTGATYYVADFAPEDWADFQAADSKGKFYYARVRQRYGNISKG